MVMSALWEGEWVDPIPMNNFGDGDYRSVFCDTLETTARR